MERKGGRRESSLLPRCRGLFFLPFSSLLARPLTAVVRRMQSRSSLAQRTAPAPPSASSTACVHTSLSVTVLFCLVLPVCSLLHTSVCLACLVVWGLVSSGQQCLVTLLFCLVFGVGLSSGRLCLVARSWPLLFLCLAGAVGGLSDWSPSSCS